MHYDDYSSITSENSVLAYARGEKPLSKWDKKTFLKVIERMECLATEKKEELGCYPLSLLKQHFLKEVGWHYTSKYLNKTTFYKIDIDKITATSLEVLKDIREQHYNEKPVIKNDDTPIKIKVQYIVWSGTRNNPIPTRYVDIVEIKGNWAYTKHGKKNIHGKGFKILK